MKRTIFTAILAIVAIVAQGQKLKMNDPSISDYLPLLKEQGYIAYSFDTKKFKGKQAVPIIKEYTDGKETNSNVINFQVSILISKKLIIGFSPAATDSTANFIYTFGEMSGFGGRLYLKPVSDPNESVPPLYMYGSRPFKLIPPFKAGEFIPLVMYGSWWYDKNFNCTRFCGDNFINPDLTSDILKDIPHYFGLGFIIKE